MNRHVLRRPDSGPTGVDLSADESAGLPADLAVKAGQRLAIMSVIYAAGYGILYGLSRVLEDFPRDAGLLSPDLVAALFIGTSLLVFAAAVSGRVNSFRLLELGLAYQVIGAIGIEIDILWWPLYGIWPEDGSFAANGISWTCPWIIVFPLIVPSTPRKAGIAALTAASMRPLMLLVLAVQGTPFAEAGVGTAALVDLILPNYICAAIAIVGARIVWGYGSDIRKARRMGSYRLTEKLGEGGMGEVWKAKHRMLARPAAIKLIRDEPGKGGRIHSPGSAVHRFHREVQATAELRSPHTVMVYDYGFTSDRTFYYVMELLDGINLQRAVEIYGPMPAERVIHVLRQVCHSLSEAHERGMVHRDIKPANIFICHYGREYDFAKVLDFGLVKHVGKTQEREQELTGVGLFAGTPAYGSPETATGGGKEVDARSDIYSLGCVAFWLLTGRTVFDAPTPVMMLVQQAKQQPDSPSNHTELAVPDELDELILECLSKDRAERPASADLLDARLSAIPLSEPWTRERARAWWDLHRPGEQAGAETADAEDHRVVVG